MIDPKKIAEWNAARAAVEARGSGSESELRLLAAAGMVLLAEREEMLAILRKVEADRKPTAPERRDGKDCIECGEWYPCPAPDCRLDAFLRPKVER